jgi:hypothetical protein
MASFDRDGIKPAEWYFTGPSMGPTLKAGDVLDIEPYSGREVLPGDVIVFISPVEENKFIIHRVVSTQNNAISTRGDNNQKADAWLLSPEEIVGRVTHAWRGRSRRRIAGGLEGRMHAGVVRLFREGALLLKALCRPAYHYLASKGPFTIAFPLNKRLRIIEVRKDGGIEQKLVLGRQVIGKMGPNAGQWEIRSPFRLFVNQDLLPTARPLD